MSGVIAAALEERICACISEEDVPLRQAELAREFGTSHIPVREALASLAQQGLVRLEPNRGAVIPALAATRCRELSLMRCELEALATRMGVPRASASQLDLAQRQLRSGQRARSLASRAAAKWGFHGAVYDACGMPFLLAELQRLWRHADRYLRYTWHHARYAARSDDEHARILLAWQRKDAREAERLTRSHIEEASLSAIALLDRQRAPTR